MVATPEAYAEDAKDRLKASIARQGELGWTLARLESEWLAIAETLETLDASA